MKIIIWGTGYYAQEFMDGGINGELLGFLETVKTRENYRGYPVYGLSDIPKNYDYIVVANSFSDEIYEICVEKKMDLTKIVFFRAGRKVTFNADEKLKEVLGEKNYTKYAAQYGVWKNTFLDDDMIKYKSMNRRKAFEIKENYLYPIVSDKYEMNSGMNVYFWQDLWAAKHIIADGITEHYDIGSRVDGFIAHLLAADIKVNVIDVRPFPGTAENLFTIVDDATMLRNFQDNSIMSLSAICSLEHFGLGRYGDPVDPEACFKCFEQIQKKLADGGKLYISIPVGQDRVEFNAHRVFYASTIITCFDQLKLREYSVIEDNKIEYDIDIHKYDDYAEKHVTGLFYFEKKKG